MIRKLFLAAQDTRDRWIPVGILEKEGDEFKFVYTKGALQAFNDGLFFPILSFPEIGRVYRSTKLFPLFSNRVLSPKREDFPEYVQWLGAEKVKDEPIELLALSGGLRETDRFEVFPEPNWPKGFKAFDREKFEPCIVE